jgi:ribosomal-protein-alanine acetyltransferase
VSEEDQRPRELLIRPALATDVPGIVALEQASFEHAGEKLSQRRAGRLTQNPRLIVRVAESGGKLLGWVAGLVWVRGKIPWGRVYAIAVDPAARGQKLGSRLMHNMLDVLQKRGAAQVFLEVRADNHAALRLYQKLGFVECRSLPNYYGAGLNAIRMARVNRSSQDP